MQQEAGASASSMAECPACGKALSGQLITALDQTWHVECFRCASCNGTFDDGRFVPHEGHAATSR